MVRRAEPAPMEKKGRFFSSASLAMASDVPELVPPISIDRPSLSIHSRALELATSALFWWSAVSTSIGRFSTLPPKSWAAHLIISPPAGPSRSAYTLDMSVMKPILTGPVFWAEAAAAKPMASALTSVLSFMVSPEG